MELDVQPQPDGTLHFVAPGNGTVATLSHLGLSVLYGLTQRGTRPALATRAQQQAAARQVATVTVQLQALTVSPGQRPALDLLPVLQELQRLGLITTAPPRHTLARHLVWPFAPVQLTQHGQRLLHWLTTAWGGWASYTRRFPL